MCERPQPRLKRRIQIIESGGCDYCELHVEHLSSVKKNSLPPFNVRTLCTVRVNPHLGVLQVQQPGEELRTAVHVWSSARDVSLTSSSHFCGFNFFLVNFVLVAHSLDAVMNDRRFVITPTSKPSAELYECG